MLMVMGLALMLTCQALISMAVAVGIGPVTGQPLPLISMGGTSMTITCIYFGIMMAVAREQNELKAQEEETKIESIQEVPDIKLD
jgi:cell division protein FtsW